MYSAVFFYPAGCTCREMNTWLKYMTIRRGRIPRFCCCRLAAANAALSLSPYLLHRAFGACHFERERERVLLRASSYDDDSKISRVFQIRPTFASGGDQRVECVSQNIAEHKRCSLFRPFSFSRSWFIALYIDSWY